MKIIRKNDRNIIKNSDDCDAFEYALADADLSGTIVEVRGRYPASGQAMNSECKQLAYILNGSGEISVEGKIIEFSKGDMILINAGEKYFWDGKFVAMLSSTPAWHFGQYKFVE
jgi:mannose-6-phosphate isomerase-like protein (cupin superfamily)